MDHYFVSWDGQLSTLHQNLLQSSSRNHSALVTLEPFSRSGLSSSSLLSDVVAGKYDSNIQESCTEFANFGRPLYVRWGHEMENLTGRYPWASADAQAFINAYRHFILRCRAFAPKALFVWSPAGNKELAAYWPGPAYVDAVGLSMYSYPAWDIGYYGYVRTFEQAFGERYGYVKAYGKPVMIAELGATGSGSEDWLRKGIAVLPQYPLVTAALFFSAKDPVTWGPNYPAPDWRLNLWALDNLPPAGVTW